MIKFFCNRCGQECPNDHASSRVFNKLDATPTGFQATPMFDGEMGDRSHVCNACLPELLVLAAKTFKGFKNGEINTNNTVAIKSVERQLETALQREEAAKAKFVEATKALQLSEKQVSIHEDTIQSVRGQLNTVNAKLEMANTKIQNTSGVKESVGKQLAGYHDQIARLQGKVESLTETLQEVTDQLGKAIATKGVADNQMASDRGTIDQLKLQVRNITAQYEAASHTKGATEIINVLRAQVKAGEDALTHSEGAKERLVTTLKTHVDSNKELQTKLKVAETSLEDIKQLLIITNKTKGINSKQLGEFEALRMQVKVLTDKLASVTKMKQAHIKQLADEDPMYIDAVHKRERQRLGGR